MTRPLDARGRAHAQTILDAVRRVVRTLRESSRASEASHGLSAAQLFVLQQLRTHGPASIGELADRTLTHQSSVSVVVSRLVEAGLARRVRSTEDSRRSEVSLSERGTRLLERAPEPLQDRLIDAIATLTPRDRAQLAHLLLRLTDRFDGGQPEPMLGEDPERGLSGRRRRDRAGA
jgi:DNA-binding MarR family transcriptional regulator